MIAVGLAPDGFRLGFHAIDAREDHDGAVEDAQRALDFGGEIDVAGCVDQVDVIALPGAADGGGGDGDAAFAFFGHVIGGGAAFVDLAHLVNLAGVEEDPFGDGRLAGVDVGDDAEVAEFEDGGGVAALGCGAGSGGQGL